MKKEEIEFQIEKLNEQLKEIKLQERINGHKLNYIELTDLIESGKCELHTANKEYENDNYVSFKIELKKIQQLEVDPDALSIESLVKLSDDENKE